MGPKSPSKSRKGRRINAATPLLDEKSETQVQFPPSTSTPQPLTTYHSIDVVVETIPNVDEKWTNTTNPMPTFTVADAQCMEWDYAHVRVEGKNRTESDFNQVDFEELGVLLDPFYDVTTGRLKRMFRLFAPHGEEKVSYDAFHEGLSALGISPPPDISFEDFVHKIDGDHDGTIDLEEFIHVVQMIKQAHLFKHEHVAADSQTSDTILRVVDYSPTSIHTIAPVTKLQSFMFSSKPTWAKVRWVHLAGFRRSDDINLRRLAIKYQLHPLALEDCLNKDDIIRCKYEHYEDHTFLCLPVIRPVDKEKKLEIESLVDRHRYDLFAKDRSLRTPSRLTKPKRRVDHAEKLDKLRVLMRKPQQLCVFICRGETVLSIQEEADDNEATGFPLWQLVFKNQMAKSYSKIRNHESSFLVISILNAVVDEMMPLVSVFEVQLTMLGKVLRAEGIKFNSKRLARAKKNMIALEKIVRPLVDLVDGQLMDEFDKGESRNYLRDIRDHLKQMATSLKESHRDLTMLVEEDKQIRMQHKDDVLYIMTVSATLFLPGTFLTGLYGMNFDNMPELHTQYGYFVWWIVFLTIISSLFTYLRVVKKWI
ncbi:hypothetical protein AC1031_009464 [Aphanomyces cochlioides]|nr:hypothetical protein AC1031_009464 [Aphanomyces cochlioides]